MKREIDWDQIALLYADRSITLKEIARRFGIHVRVISRQARLEGWPPRHRKRTQYRRETKLRALIERMFRALDRQMHDIETRLLSEETQRAERSAAERERDARTLGALTRTLEKLRDLERESAAAIAAVSAARSGDDGQKAANTESLRGELERRLDRLIAAAAEKDVSQQPD